MKNKKQKTNRFCHIMAVTAFSIFLASSLCGCGSESAEMTTFQTNMTTFYENIADKNAKMNALDPEDENSVTELLSLLDSIAADFEMLDSMEIPKEYAAIDQFANEGKQYMNEAARLYHQALEGDDNYENILVAAKENYRRANLRLQYINDILEGKEPEIE